MAKRHFASLCIDAGLPLSGADGAAGRGVLAGLRMQIPAVGLIIGGYRIRLCHAFDDRAGVVRNARRASETVLTIAYVGELSGSQASVADTLLAQAGIALITPSGPAPAAAASPTGSPPAPVAPRPTVLYLLPAARTQADAVTELRSQRGCDMRRRGKLACTVFSPAAAPLCTGIAAASSRAPRRYCVVAGPDLASGWASPAVAYGKSAGQLLVSSLRAIAARGRDVADRATVLDALAHANLRNTPIGAIRFDSQGGMEADSFTAYTVEPDGRLILSHMLRTH